MRPATTSRETAITSRMVWRSNEATWRAPQAAPAAAATIMPMRVSGSTCTAPIKIRDWVTVGNTHWPLRVPGSSRSSISLNCL